MEEGKVTALEQCLVLVRGTQRSQASEGVATQKGLHSLVPAPGGAGGRREVPPVLGRDLPVVSSRLHFLTCQTKGFQVPLAPTRLCDLLGLGQPD